MRSSPASVAPVVVGATTFTGGAGSTGVPALEACGDVQSGNYWRALVSSRLDADIAVVARPREGVRVLVRGPSSDGGPYEPDRIPEGLARRVAVPDWEVWTACRR